MKTSSANWLEKKERKKEINTDHLFSVLGAPEVGEKLSTRLWHDHAGASASYAVLAENPLCRRATKLDEDKCETACWFEASKQLTRCTPLGGRGN